MDCPKCGENKPDDQFYITKAGKRLSWCKPCWKIYRQSDIRNTTVRKHRLTEKFRLAHKSAAARHREKYPEKIAARNIARRVPQGHACSKCKSYLRLERHHPDYGHPMLVIVLCEKCHKETHYAMS